jgi:6,7-dimethyl-8-ribityllumazine synthase
VKQPPGERPDGAGLRVLVLRSAFNAPVVAGLARGCVEELLGLGTTRSRIESLEVPGAFELPLAARVAAASGRYDAIVALGAVIKGDTDHYEHVARASISGLARVTLRSGVPVALGVLTVRKEAQALARARPGPDHKGAEAARAAVAMVHALRSLRAGARRASAGRARGRGR